MMIQSFSTTTHYTISTYLTDEQKSWAYIVRGPKGLILDTRCGYATRSEAEGSAHMWLRSFLAK